MKKLILLIFFGVLLSACNDEKSIETAKFQINKTFLRNDVALIKYNVISITDKEAFGLLNKKYNKQYQRDISYGQIFKENSANMLKYSKLEYDSKGLLKYKKVDFYKMDVNDTVNKGYVVIDPDGKYLDFEIIK